VLPRTLLIMNTQGGMLQGHVVATVFLYALFCVICPFYFGGKRFFNLFISELLTPLNNRPLTIQNLQNLLTLLDTYATNNTSL